MGEKERVIGAAGGAVGLGVFGALLATCCAVPWAVVLLGVTGAVALARLAFLLPYAVAGAMGLLAIAFWFAYRRPTVCADDTCQTDNRRRLRWVVWGAALMVAGLVSMVLLPLMRT
jgi:hypothetical protein